MKGAHFALAVSLAAALWVTSAPAVADGPKPLAASLDADARGRYEAGRQHFVEGRYAEALAAFDEAFTRSQDRRLLWNMAACERKLGHNGRALLLLQDYLLAPAGLLSRKEEDEAKASVVALRALVAQVTVKPSPETLDVFVDGKRVATTPLAGRLYIDQGTHRVRFSRDGYAAEERTEECKGGSDVVWTVELRKDRPPLATARSDGATAAPPPEPFPWGPAVTLSAGGLVALGGGVLVGVSRADYGSLRDECSPACDPADVSGARTRMTVGNVMLGVGAAAVVAGALWLVLAPPNGGGAKTTAARREALAP